MKTVEKLIRQYIANDETRVMQLATVDGNQPWICTVWFVADDDLNLYWLSFPTRRHSQEIDKNAKVAAAIVIKDDMPTIGLQIEGKAVVVTEAAEVKKIMEKYVKKFHEGELFYDRFLAGSNKHVLYRLEPRVIALIDDAQFPDAGIKEWRPQGIDA